MTSPPITRPPLRRAGIVALVVFAVADVFDALTTDRPYKAALSYRRAVDMIARERAVHFDPEAVEAFLKIPFRDLAETAARNGVVLISP